VQDAEHGRFTPGGAWCKIRGVNIADLPAFSWTLRRLSPAECRLECGMMEDDV
jgi:hypothetical protein